MAKALFHKGQRVYVKTVGTWAAVERVTPQWVKGVEEPLRISYDVGLGREFQAHELTAEDKEPARPDLIVSERWRVLRASNRMSAEARNPRHPFPGTFPVVVTDEQDWGGWRVPMAEYDRDPQRVEHQARVMANGLHLMRIARSLIEYAQDFPDAAPAEVADLARQAEMVLAAIYQEAPGPAFAAAE
jgi:hypothetical protein